MTLTMCELALPSADPSSVSRPKEQIGELSFTSFEDPLDPANLSIGQSEVSLSNLDLEAELQKVFNPPQPDSKDDVPRLSDLIPRTSTFSTSTPPRHTPPLSFATSGSSSISVDEQVVQRERSPPLHVPLQSRTSPVPIPASDLASCPPSSSGMMFQQNSGSPTHLDMRRRSDSPLHFSSRLFGSPALWSASPSMRTGSPLREIANAQELRSERTPRTRISRDDIQMRLMGKRSTESPLGDALSSPAPAAELLAAEKSDEEVPHVQSIKVPDPAGLGRENKGRSDVTSGVIDISAEFATIQTAEKRTMDSATVGADGREGDKHNEEDTMDGNVSATTGDEEMLPVKSSIVEPVQPQPTAVRPQSSFGLLETSLDVSGGLGIGLRDSMGSIQLGEMRSALDRLMDDVKDSCGPSTKRPNARSHARVESVTEDTKAGRSSANTSSNIGDDSMGTQTDMELSLDDFRSAPITQRSRTGPLPVQRAATDSVVYMGPSFRSPVDEVLTPASPTKDAIKTREELILQKRREARKRDEEESMGYYTPPRPTSMPPSTGRPSRRRSRSTGDAGALTKSNLLLDIGLSDTEEELLADSISKELRRLDPEHRQGVSFSDGRKTRSC